jgi:hypothetical protein
MPGGAGDGEVARIALGATDAAVLESACRLAAPTPASHDALWATFAEVAAGSAECASAIKIMAGTATKANENAKSRSHGSFRPALNVLDPLPWPAHARARADSM